MKNATTKGIIFKKNNRFLFKWVYFFLLKIYSRLIVIQMSISMIKMDFLINKFGTKLYNVRPKSTIIDANNRMFFFINRSSFLFISYGVCVVGLKQMFICNYYLCFLFLICLYCLKNNL